MGFSFGQFSGIVAATIKVYMWTYLLLGGGTGGVAWSAVGGAGGGRETTEGAGSACSQMKREGSSKEAGSGGRAAGPLCPSGACLPGPGSDPDPTERPRLGPQVSLAGGVDQGLHLTESEDNLPFPLRPLSRQPCRTPAGGGAAVCDLPTNSLLKLSSKTKARQILG